MKRHAKGVKGQLQMSNSDLSYNSETMVSGTSADVVPGVRLFEHIVVINGVVVTNEP